MPPAEIPIDPITKGEDARTMRAIEKNFAPFENKHTWWRLHENGRENEFDDAFDDAVAELRKDLGQTYPLVIDGQEVTTDDTFTVRSPADQDLVIGHFGVGTTQHVEGALKAAHAGFAAWSARPWQERAEIIERTADVFTENFYRLSAVMSLEAGKTRFEASIDVDEAIDFLRFYAYTMREMNGFAMEMGHPFPNEDCVSIRKPFGVFSVVCPFNFPVAITTGMTAGALITGNTALMKPSGKGGLSGWHVYQYLREAGVPGDVLQFLTGGTHEVSNAMVTNPGVDGIVFTGSKNIGMRVIKNANADRPRPVVAEMGGKNAIIVSAKADLDKAVPGVFKSAFGFSGQKCSACSRVYVHRDVADDFLQRLKTMTEDANVGLPWEQGVFMGPVIEQRKVELFEEVVQQVKDDGGTVVAGGHVIENYNGYYVEPTVVTGLPLSHRVFREEFFMPFTAVGVVDSFDEGIDEYNLVEYGLTGGCFTEDKAEADRFFDRIHCGVTYWNRAAGGSTAAVVNGQSFVGWKLSGSTGNGAGGRYYLTQFTREQSQTRVRYVDEAEPTEGN